MDAGVELVRDIVRSQLPACDVGSIRPLGGGEDHVAYEVGGELVVRFGRDAGTDACARRTVREVALLQVVSRVAPVAVPRPRFAVPERCCYAYAKLGGVPMLSLRPELRARHARSVATSLGELLGALHAIPVAGVADLVPTDVRPAAEWLGEAADLHAQVARHVPAPHDRAIRAFLETAPPEAVGPPVFSHDDLGIEHVLVDPDTGRVTGVIDWSDAAICDPARDFGLLLRDLGPDALDVALAGNEHAANLPERAWFHARCAAIEDLAYGLDTGRTEYARKTLDALDWLFASTYPCAGRGFHGSDPRRSPRA